MTSTMKQYSSLIVVAKRANRKKLDNSDPAYAYFEWHHIWPVAFGRDDGKQNLVLLTFAEHVEAHVLLAKLYPRHYGLQITANWMLTDKKGESASVELAAEARAQAGIAGTERLLELSEIGKHPWQQIEYKLAQAERMQSSLNPLKKPENSTAQSNRMRELGSKSKHPMQKSENRVKFGKRILQLAEEGQLYTQTAEGKEVLSNRMALENRRLVECPHCCKTGGCNAMKYRHFDNCPLIKHPETACDLSEATKWLPCSDCDRFFLSKAARTKHKRNKHSGGA